MSPRAPSRTGAQRQQLPSVDELLKHPSLDALASELGRPVVREAARDVLAGLRARLRRPQPDAKLALTLDHLPQEIEAEARERLALSLRPVINATGVVLHTNLGRAPLSSEAAEHVRAVASQYSNLEYDLLPGTRGARDQHAARLLNRLLGAESSLVVNNNAAALLLALNTLAEGGEVVVSRGELIEIGESFRIPEILAKSGAVLREVGTTNRTRVGDYARAISPRTRLLLRVHPSNFRVLGFTERPELPELVAVARRHRLPLVEDLGSGLVVKLTAPGLAREPIAQTSLEAGVDLIAFSGDKLLGGPQAGILAGKARWVERCRKNPLFRALRVDKMTYAALQATVRSLLRGKEEEIPAVQLIELTPEEIGRRAEALRARLAPDFAGRAELSLRPGQSVIGGGSTPGSTLETKLLAIFPRSIRPAELAARLRRSDPPVVARVESNRVLLDLRTVFPEQEGALEAALRTALRE